MHSFSIPGDNAHTLERSHYEILKHLLKINSPITRISPIAPGRTICYAASLHEKSRSTNARRCNAIKKVIEMDNSINEDNCDLFAHRILQMIDNKCHDEFFCAHDKKSDRTKSVPIMISLC